MASNQNKGGYSGITVRRTGETPKRSHGLIAGVAVVVVATIVGVAFWLLGDDAKPEPEPQPNISVKPAKSIERDVAVEQPKPRINHQDKKEVREDKVEKAKPEFVKRPGAMQLPDGRVLTFPVPKEGEYRIVHSHGSTYKCDHLGNWEDITPKPIFDNAFEENLVSLASENGNFIPGMLMGLDDAEVVKMLKKPVQFSPDDSDEVRAKKESVVAAKEEILQYMAAGGTFDGYIKELRELTVQERGIRSMATKEIVTMLKEGREQDAARFTQELNGKLAEAGLRPMKFPAHITSILDAATVPEPNATETQYGDIQ